MNMIEMAMGYFRSRVLCAAARLGVADALAGGAREVAEIAAVCHADPESLYRLLRALAAIGVTAETAPGSFVLTAFGEPLRKDAPGSVWPSVVFWSDLLAENWSYLTECVQSGDTAAHLMEQQGVQSRWSKDPHAQSIFRAVMGTAPVEDYLPIVRSWDFSHSRVVADLGGGGGSLIRAVLQSDPHLQGMLVDRPAAIEEAKPRFEAEGLLDRCRMIGADLTEEVPGGADVYLMKHVLHGYKDAAAIAVLRNCRQAMLPGAYLLVIEFVLLDVVSVRDSSMEMRLMSDLNMMAATGGQERSGVEWVKLLHRSGFELQRVIPASGGMSIIEALPV